MRALATIDPPCYSWPMTERRHIELQQASESAWRSEPSDPVADMLTAAELRLPPDRLVLSPQALVAYERLFGVEATFDGPTPPAVLAARAAH